MMSEEKVIVERVDNPDTWQFTVHMNLDLEGLPADIQAFHDMMTWLDSDWPYSKENRIVSVCGYCEGAEYINPMIAPQDVKLAGKMHNVKVKIKRYCQDETCRGNRPLVMRYMNNDRHIEGKPGIVYC
jgi:hypothetical protein